MSDYIKREDVINAIRKMVTLIWNLDGLDYGEPMQGLIIPADVISEITSIKSADVRENVHGIWLVKDGWYSECSACKKYYVHRGDEYDYRFCPGCGADMRGEPDE